MRKPCCLSFGLLIVLALAFPLVWVGLSGVARADVVLVQYGFDSMLPSAADGFYIFENSRGWVEPTNTVKFSGYRSLELQEAPADGTFVELQGVVKPITSGDVLFHFAFLVRNPEEELNIAVAGPAHFYLQRDGIAFWLKTIDGTLSHRSGNVVRPLFKLRANVWYVVDAVFHVESGTYDLRILNAKEPTPLVLLDAQPNAINAPGSKLSKLSFIGDLEDRSTVHYFIDDVELRLLSAPLSLAGPRNAEREPPHHTRTLTAPTQSLPRDFIVNGSPSSPRWTYFDEYLEYKKLELSLPQCLPAISLRDFDIQRAALNTDSTLQEEVRQAMKMPTAQFVSPLTFATRAATGILLWRRGCLALSDGKIQEARSDLTQALTLLPNAPILQASRAILANVMNDRREVEKQLLALSSVWAEDARLPVLLGMLPAYEGNFDAMRNALTGVATRLGGGRKQLTAIVIDRSGEPLHKSRDERRDHCVLASV
ncbi:MAG: hypothetical protein FJ147_05480 [Deltaproteobacteria bacterium]|nr:hypothetical protein [Deltaproteobacteria bacterium]